MTIRKGSEYGSSLPLPADAPVVSTDAELHNVVARAQREERLPITVGLLGGDLCRTLGGTGDRDRLDSSDARTLPIDLVLASCDDEIVPVVSHLIVGRLFGSHFTSIMNAQWFGDVDLGPRSHPGDGLVDVTSGELPLRQRFLARRRARSGTHLPHPLLTYRRLDSYTLRYNTPVSVRVDNALVLSAQVISVEVHPDAFSVVI
jgi:hypothetical protein